MSLVQGKEALFDEVFDSQKNFRVLLDSMSRPGEVFMLKEHCFDKFPEYFNPHVLTILKTLCDNNVTLFSCSRSFQNYLQINTGAELTDSANTSDYALFDGSEYYLCFTGVNTGTQEFPENSTTAILTVRSLAEGLCPDFCEDTLILRMKGPGIKYINTLFVNGLDCRYASSFISINRGFPQGFDMILVDLEGRIACLTRTTRLEVA